MKLIVTFIASMFFAAPPAAPRFDLIVRSDFFAGFAGSAGMAFQKGDMQTGGELWQRGRGALLLQATRIPKSEGLGCVGCHK